MLPPFIITLGYGAAFAGAEGIAMGAGAEGIAMGAGGGAMAGACIPPVVLTIHVLVPVPQGIPFVNALLVFLSLLLVFFSYTLELLLVFLSHVLELLLVFLPLLLVFLPLLLHFQMHLVKLLARILAQILEVFAQINDTPVRFRGVQWSRRCFGHKAFLSNRHSKYNGLVAAYQTANGFANSLP